MMALHPLPELGVHPTVALPKRVQSRNLRKQDENKVKTGKRVDLVCQMCQVGSGIENIILTGIAVPIATLRKKWLQGAIHILRLSQRGPRSDRIQPKMYVAHHY